MKLKATQIVIYCLLIFTFLSCNATRKTNWANFEKKAIVTIPEKQLPKDDLPSKRIEIELKDRTLYANWVLAGKDVPAFFICHGNGETLTDWRPLQAYLYKKGFSSFVFDYAGFGSSTGKPTAKNFDQDTKASYAKFVEFSTESSQRIAFAHSLGCGILLNIANQLKPLPTKVVIHGAFSTAHEIIVEKGFAQPEDINNYPNEWNGLIRVRQIKSPLFIVHSTNDEVIPIAMSEKLAKSAGSKALFLKLNSQGHNAVYEQPTDNNWNPIFKFIQIAK